MSKNQLSIATVTICIFIASVFRLIPHPSNFAPVGAIALFGGVYLSGNILSIFLPIITLFIGDLILNNIVYAAYNPSFVWFYDGFYWVYGSFVAIVALGWLLSKRLTFLNVLAGSLTSSVLFFVVTNLGVWLGSGMYSKNTQGLLECYTMALPFFSNGILGDLAFNGLLFGVYFYADKKFALSSKQA